MRGESWGGVIDAPSLIPLAKDIVLAALAADVSACLGERRLFGVRVSSSATCDPERLPSVRRCGLYALPLLTGDPIGDETKELCRDDGGVDDEKLP